ncbi:MAG: hypothetical protein AAGA77_02285 [Bacteroidota bacterium]
MKYIIAIFIAFGLSLTTQAQVDDEGRASRQERMQSRIESQKVAFITQKLDLSPTEAQQFWPIYNEYQATIKEFRQQNRIEIDYQDISESDADTFLDDLLNKEQEELDIKKRYSMKLKTAVSAKKVAQLHIIEKKFREEVLSTIRSRMGKKKREKRKNRNSGF